MNIEVSFSLLTTYPLVADQEMDVTSNYKQDRSEDDMEAAPIDNIMNIEVSFSLLTTYPLVADQEMDVRSNCKQDRLDDDIEAKLIDNVIDPHHCSIMLDNSCNLAPSVTPADSTP